MQQTYDHVGAQPATDEDLARVRAAASFRIKRIRDMARQVADGDLDWHWIVTARLLEGELYQLLGGIR